MASNLLDRSGQKELLRYMVERVIVDLHGIVRLELLTPFAYLSDLAAEVQGLPSGSGQKT
jgi:hypothetical protein